MKEKRSISLNPATLRKLKRIAKKRDRSVSFIVNELLEQNFLSNGSAIRTPQSEIESGVPA